MQPVTWGCSRAEGTQGRASLSCISPGREIPICAWCCVEHCEFTGQIVAAASMRRFMAESWEALQRSAITRNVKPENEESFAFSRIGMSSSSGCNWQAPLDWLPSRHRIYVHFQWSEVACLDELDGSTPMQGSIWSI